MLLIFFVGLSASGKTSIAEQVAQNLDYPLISLRDIVHEIATQEGFARSRDWMETLDDQRRTWRIGQELTKELEKHKSSPAIIFDELANQEMKKFCEGQFGDEAKSLTVLIRVNRHLRKRRYGEKAGLSKKEAKEELDFINGMKERAGIAEIIRNPDIKVVNMGRFDEVVEDALSQIREAISIHPRGIERA